MPLIHNGQLIRGKYSTPLIDRRELQVQRTKFFGVEGESEILGGRSGRVIEINHWFFGDYSSRKEIATALQRLDARTGNNGRLELTEMTLLFYDCTFEGYELLYGPLQDIAQTLDGGYWAELSLRFRQLSPELS